MDLPDELILIIGNYSDNIYLICKKYIRFHKPIYLIVDHTLIPCDHEYIQYAPNYIHVDSKNVNHFSKFSGTKFIFDKSNFHLLTIAKNMQLSNITLEEQITLDTTESVELQNIVNIHYIVMNNIKKLSLFNVVLSKINFCNYTHLIELKLNTVSDLEGNIVINSLQTLSLYKCYGKGKIYASNIINYECELSNIAILVSDKYEKLEYCKLVNTDKIILDYYENLKTLELDFDEQQILNKIPPKLIKLILINTTYHVENLPNTIRIIDISNNSRIIMKNIKKIPNINYILKNIYHQPDIVDSVNNAFAPNTDFIYTKRYISSNTIDLDTHESNAINENGYKCKIENKIIDKIVFKTVFRNGTIEINNCHINRIILDNIYGNTVVIVMKYCNVGEIQIKGAIQIYLHNCEINKLLLRDNSIKLQTIVELHDCIINTYETYATTIGATTKINTLKIVKRILSTIYIECEVNTFIYAHHVSIIELFKTFSSINKLIKFNFYKPKFIEMSDELKYTICEGSKLVLKETKLRRYPHKNYMLYYVYECV